MALYAFDGTWNDSTAPDEQRDARKDTNVHRFRVLYNGKTEYVNGVGTRFGFIGKVVGGMTGAGAEQRITEHFAALKRNFAAGDTDIDIVGYSRGAAIARMFVLRIERDFEFLTDADGKALTRAPLVRYLGLFDTVASFGIPWTASEGDFKPDVPEFVVNTFHAMALDETRETFGIERCLGNRNKITEVWFRGGHGDIGGNATYVKKQGEVSNRERSDIALNWMISKANACGLPVAGEIAVSNAEGSDQEAPVTTRAEFMSIGNVGTLSRRIHIGDLVHHTVELAELTRGIDGRMLRRINVPTRIENQELEKSNAALIWVVPDGDAGSNNLRVTSSNPSIVELSTRRYPFDVLPARTWKSWLEHWKLENPGISEDRLLEFWAPQEADRGLAWDLYVELMTRITTQEMDDNDDETALKSVYTLFPLARDYMHKHSLRSANTAALLTAYLNQKVRLFTAKWHKRAIDEKWKDNTNQPHPEFHTELKALQPVLRQLADALSHLADARL